MRLDQDLHLQIQISSCLIHKDTKECPSQGNPIETQQGSDRSILNDNKSKSSSRLHISDMALFHVFLHILLQCMKKMPEKRTICSSLTHLSHLVPPPQKKQSSVLIEILLRLRSNTLLK